MCGIAGFFRNGSGSESQQREWLSGMGKAIYHRGPDAGSTYMDDDIALAHRRLSIIDLSEAGIQPMRSASSRFTIVYNGEIYNFPTLRKELKDEGIQFHSGTDTEVLLNLFERDGAACLNRLNGMFAFAIWDHVDKSLFLARDRLGKKPLYYYGGPEGFAFASEIKALLPLPYISQEIRLDAVKDFFFYQYVPDPKTIYNHIYKLPPAHWMKVGKKGIELVQYWDVKFASQPHRSEHQIQDELYDLIDDAVKIRMLSDVPLGAFLSGGIDSSAVVGMMAGHSSKPVTTCSIGFDSKKYDEVIFAKKVADQFNTDHHEFTVRETVADNFTAISRYFDEPFSDPSYIPTFFVSQLARKAVTVALAGDGGDENFAGYSKYTTDRIENRLRSLIPVHARRHLFPPLVNSLGRINYPMARKARSLLTTLSLNPDQGFFITNSFFSPLLWDRLAIGALRKETADYDPSEITKYYYNQADTDDHLSRVLYTDIKTYLPGDILVKVDRMSMANSLEIRAPLLDYRVVEYAASIPSHLKLKSREKKYILKRSMERLLSGDTLYRKKMGFSVPLANWLRCELKDIVEAFFFSANSGIKNFFEVAQLRQVWLAHLEGDFRHTYEIWSMLVFETWWQNYMAASEASETSGLAYA